MEWNNDEYRDLKWIIFDLIRKNIYQEDQNKITIKNLTDGIDRLFDFLIKDNE